MRKKIYTFRGYLCAIPFLFSLFYCDAQTVNIYASTVGSTTGNGATASSPVTINRAREIAQANPTHPCTIWLASGVYYKLALDASDSRAYTAPVTYQSMTKNGAIFQPEISLSPSSFSAIPASIQSRIIDPTAKTMVKQISLASYNFRDMAPWGRTFAEANLKAPKFYRNGNPLPMSRWPADTSWMHMASVVTKGSAGSSPGGTFKYRDARAKYWQSALSDGGVYLMGNWQVPWIMDVILTKSINTTDSTITQDIGISQGLGSLSWRNPPGTEPYCAINLVEEIRAEGQWAINFNTQTLYMWVPSSGTLTMSGDWKIPAISATNVNNTNFVGITVRGGSGNGIELTNCINILVAGSRITYCSRNGVTITDGKNCVIQSNDIDSVGAGGVIISSSNFVADQQSVNKSGHQVINNHIYSYAREAYLYSAAVNVYSAVGTYVAYNKVHDCPHVGIMYGGNSNRLEYNEVYDVVKKYSDMGCFYTWSDTAVWNRRGNTINHNYVHDAPLAHGLYGDNYSSGDSNTYNIVTGVSMALFDHYGYFNGYYNNICINDTYPVTTMTEATTSPTYSLHYGSLNNLWNGSSAYKQAYPECADMVGPSGRNEAYTSKIWPVVAGNVFINNPGVMSNVNDHLLFNDDGTTNAAYAQTGPAFVTWGTVFKDNFKMKGVLLKPIIPFSVDSLRSTTAFAKTSGTDWHINRIGLHIDAYRTDISSTKTMGLDPKIDLHVTTNNNYKNPQILTLTACVKAPNAAKVFSSVKFFQYQSEMKNMTITKNVISYDSVTYTLKLSNPSVDPSVPDFHITFRGYDGQFWQYVSNMVVYTITPAPVTTTSLAVAQDPNTVKTATALQWTSDNEQNVDSYQVMESTDSANYNVIATVKAKCNDTSKCAYYLPATPPVNRVSYYRVHTLSKDSTLSVSNTVHLGDDVAARLTLFPNPAKNYITVNFLSPDDVPGSSLIVYDVQGKILSRQPFAIHAGLNSLGIPLNNMANGIYLMGLEINSNPIVIKRFIIQQ